MIPKTPSDGAGSTRGFEKFEGCLGSKLLYESGVRVLVATGGKVVVCEGLSTPVGILER